MVYKFQNGTPFQESKRGESGMSSFGFYNLKLKIEHCLIDRNLIKRDDCLAGNFLDEEMKCNHDNFSLPSSMT